MARKRPKKAPSSRRIPGEVADIALSLLDLDPKNPRLPVGKRTASQEELLQYIAEEYEPIEIARSIALYGYFPSEPMIVLKEKGRYLVLEGNRRLTALRLLSEANLAERLDLEDAEEWSELAEQAEVPASIPVVITGDRRSVAPIIGYRHISGIEPWDPWSKARFIAALVDEERLSFEEAAAEVGEAPRDVRAHYRNFRIALQARTKFGIPTERLERRFGVFTRAMQDSDITAFVDAPRNEKVLPGVDPLPSKARGKLSELVSWLFGTPNQPPIITDSRRIRQLGKVLGAPPALKVLRSTSNLEEAFATAGGLRDRLLNYLTRAQGALEKAQMDLDEYLDDEEVEARVKACQALADDMLAAMS